MVDTIKGAEYTIHKRGADGKRGVIIDKYIALQIEQRWTEPSKFVITGKGLTRVPLTIGDGVDIYRDGALFLTGVVDTAEESCDEMQHGIIDWTVTGRDITSLLERRLVLPDPVGLNFSEAVQDVMTDTVGNAIRRYVERNAGESAATGRRLGSLTVDVAEPDEGNTYAYRLMTLDKVCAEIGAGEAMPVIDWNPETGDIELNVITRREKADTVIFSPVNGTITRWTKKKKLPKANALWAISGGDEQIVTYTQHAQSIAAYGRFEGYIKDSAQMQEATEEEPAVTAEDVAAILENKSAEKLNKEAATESYSVDVCESPSLRFIEHWKCGDRVTCIIDGEEIVSTIESVSIFTSQTGERLSAKIGEVERGIFAELFEQIAELQEKVEVEQAITSVVVNGGGGGSSSSVLDAYPIGSIYMSVNSTNPGTLFGGTWSAWGAGRVPVGFDSSQSEFDTVEETGGSKTHSLTAAEMPSHRHWISNMAYDDGNCTGSNDTSQDNGLAADAGSYKANDQIKTAGRYGAYAGSSAGADGKGASASTVTAHNNLQPYITCYMWKRTA